MYFSRVSYLFECNANDTYVLRMTHINGCGDCNDASYKRRFLTPIDENTCNYDEQNNDDDVWVILKTYVSLALHSKGYETRLKYTAEVCNVLLISDVRCFEKHPHVSIV